MKKILSWLSAGLMISGAVIPIFYIVLHSLKGQALIKEIYTHKSMYTIWQRMFIKPFYVNLDQYYEVFLKTPGILYMFWNSMSIVLPVVVGQGILAFLAAYGFSQLKFPGSETLFFLYIVIMLMPFQVTMVPHYMMLRQLKLLNTRWALILPGMFNTFSVFFLKQFMESIGRNYLEEARLLGAGEGQILRYIILPMSKPVILSVILFVFMDYWSMVEQPVLFLKTEAAYPLSAYLGTITTENIGAGFAGSVLYMVVPVWMAVYAREDLVESFKMTNLK